jgi:hypothetical protein
MGFWGARFLNRLGHLLTLLGFQARGDLSSRGPCAPRGTEEISPAPEIRDPGVRGARKEEGGHHEAEDRDHVEPRERRQLDRPGHLTTRAERAGACDRTEGGGEEHRPQGPSPHGLTAHFRRGLARHEDGRVASAQHHASRQKRNEAARRGGEDDQRGADGAEDLAERQAPAPTHTGRPTGDEDRRGSLSDDEEP